MTPLDGAIRQRANDLAAFSRLWPSACLPSVNNTCRVPRGAVLEKESVMFKRSVRLLTTAALVVGALTACHEGPGPTEVSQPTAETFPTAWLNGALYDAELTVETAALYAAATGAALVSSDDSPTRTATKAIIGRDGGTISVGGHTLEIPRGAVEENTVFVMEVVAGTSLVVDLSAYEADDGDRVDKFDRDLTLTLSYAGWVSDSDADELRNVYLFQDAEHLLVPLESWLDMNERTVSSPIDHFSQYGMAIE